MRFAGLRWLLVLLLVLAAASAQARDCVSRRNGNWSANNTWRCDGTNNNGPPLAGDSAVVNHNLSLDADTNNLAGLTINAGGAISYAASNLAINLQGSLVNNGTIVFDGTSGSIDLTGASVWGGSGQFTLDHVDLANNALTIATDATFTLRLRDPNSPLRNLGSFNNTSPNRTATVELNSNGNQLLNQNGVQFPNLHISGSGVKTLPAGSPLNILGNLVIDAGNTFLTTNGINLGGNLTINGTLSPNDGPWTFNGTTTQTISAATSFRRIVVNNPQGISLGGNMTIGDTSWGDLTLSNGRIATNAFSVVVLRACGDAWLAGRTAGSWINGNLQLTAPPYNASCFFPVGDASNYAPITFAYPYHAEPLGGAITGSTTAGEHPDTTGGISGINVAKSVNRYWTLTQGGGSTFYTFDATFQYCNSTGSADCAVNDVDAAATPANFIVAEKLGTTWSSLPPTTPSLNERKVSGLTAVGVFAIGEAGSIVVPTCITDNFSVGLNSALWNVSGSGYTPQVVTSPTVPTSRLRLTDNNGNRATMAQLKKWFPAANNKVVVEFDYYVYGGSGADGISVVLSDAGVPPTPGGYGGSLGYANRSGINGFNGGWLGFGLDEFGNYPNSTEGRRGYPAGYTPPVGANAAAGFYQHSIAVRGSGVGQVSGYALLANSGVVSPVLTTTNAVPNRYRITVDHSNSINAMVSVERNAGSGYVTVIPAFDAKGPNSGQTVVPVNMLLSFAGSTGGSTNFHEIGNVQVCATNITDPGGSSDAANFECIETGVLPTWSTTARHPLYTKITNANFKFDIVALKSDGTIENNFVAAGGNAKDVTVELFDDTTPPGSCSAYASSVATQTVQYVSGDGGRKTMTGNVNLNTAWGKLRCRVRDANASPTVYGCSTDTFSVRPQSYNSVASSANGDSAGTSTNASTVVKAGAAFSLTAGTGKQGYGGLPKIDAAKTEWLGVPVGGRPAPGVGTLGGVFSSPANPANGNGASGNAFSYSEVGYFRFQPQGVYDDTFSALAADTTNSDCINTPPNDFSNTLVGGKYGCKFGNTVATNHFGRFIPDHFTASLGSFVAACNAGGFSYMSQPFATALGMTVEARNSSDVRTQNYSGAFATGVVGIQMENNNSGTAIPAARLQVTNAPAWNGGSYSIAADRFLRDAVGPDGVFDALDIGLSVSDEAALAANQRPYLMTRDMDASNVACTTDLTGLSAAAGVCGATKLVSAAKMRFGRLRLSNTYVSALPLNIPVQAQYWSGLSWVNNGADSCTALATGNVKLSNAAWTVGAPSTLSAGSGSIPLAPPASAKSGFVELCVDLASDNGTASCSGTVANMPWLQSKWPGGSDYNNDPSAQATFGIFSPERKKGVFNREIY